MMSYRTARAAAMTIVSIEDGKLHPPVATTPPMRAIIAAGVIIVAPDKLGTRAWRKNNDGFINIHVYDTTSMILSLNFSHFIAAARQKITLAAKICRADNALSGAKTIGKSARHLSH